MLQVELQAGQRVEYKYVILEEQVRMHHVCNNACVYFAWCATSTCSFGSGKICDCIRERMHQHIPDDWLCHAVMCSLVSCSHVLS